MRHEATRCGCPRGDLHCHRCGGPIRLVASPPATWRHVEAEEEIAATIYPDGSISFTEPSYTVHQHGSVVLVDFPPSAGRIGHLAAVRFPYEAMADAFVRSLR